MTPNETPGRRFAGLSAVVTGARSGIGLATSRLLLAEGATVGAMDVAPTVHESGEVQLVADVTDAQQVAQAVDDFAAHAGGIDILINNAGIGAVGSIEDGSDDEWHRLFDVNVLGVTRVTRAALPYLRRAQHGAIVNVSSVVAFVGVRQRACYSSTKGAVASLTLAMAADLVEAKVRVNCVAPGTADTPWVERLLEASTDPAAQRRSLEARQPMGRLGSAEEIAHAIAFLAAPSSSFITGTILSVDGGIRGVRV